MATALLTVSLRILMLSTDPIRAEDRCLEGTGTKTEQITGSFPEQ